MDKQVIPIKFAGLDAGSDPKSAPFGRCSLLENTQSQRTTEGGVEIEKRPGTPSKARDIAGGGSLAAGAKVAAYAKELVMTDGSALYSWRELEQKWAKRGRVTDIGAIVEYVEANQGTLALDPDVAYANGYLMFTASRATGGAGDAEFYLVDATSGALVATGAVGDGNLAYKVRVVASATVFFVFSWDGPAGTSIRCQKLDTAAAITGLSAASVVANNVVSTARYDVIRDTTNGRTVVCYRNTTPTTTLMIWNDNMSAGTTVAYATRNADQAVGFLDWDFSDGNGYVAIGTTATGVRVLTFGASSMTVTADTQVDGAATTPGRVTGYYSGTKRNVFYMPTTGVSTWNRVVSGWSDGTSFTVYRSVTLHGRAFSMQGKRYLMVTYLGDSTVSKQNSVFLIEMVTDTTNATAGDISVAAVLAAGNGSGLATTQRPVAGVAIVSSTKAVLTFSVSADSAVPGATTTLSQEAVAKATLDWTGTLTGRPVEHNGVLYLPQACAKVYDGHATVEVGPHVYPEKPTLTAGSGGSLTVSSTYTYIAIYFRYDATGKRVESAASFPSVIALGGADTKVTVDVPTLRITEAAAAYNLNPKVTPWRIAVYRTAANGQTFRLVSVLDNSLTVDTVQLADTAADSSIATNPPPYDDTGAADHVIPAAVLAFESHQDRIVAMAADAVFPSKENVAGSAAGFAADTEGFFLDFDISKDGPLVGLVSDGTTLFISSRNRIYPLQGAGPDLQGNNGYAFPSPLPAPAGLRGPRGFVSTPDGIIVDTAKGKHLLDRAGGMLPIPGADAYDSLTVTGGVALDDRPMALLTTSDGRTLCWDWQLKVWHTWTGQAAVACCLWQNKFVWLESNGKVHVETPGAYADDAGAYTWSVKPAWFNIRHCRIRKGLIYADILGSTTVSYVASYDHDATTAETAKTLAVTTATKLPLVLTGAKGRANALEYLITETSTTAGLRLSSLELEIMAKPGAAKFAAGSYLR